jgi:hypothetical protein
MREDNTAGIIEEILSYRDMLTAISDDIPADEADNDVGTMLSREDIKNDCEVVKADAAKGVCLGFTFL